MHRTFDQTYPRHEFAPLVRLAGALAGWVMARFESREARAPAGAAGQAA